MENKTEIAFKGLPLWENVQEFPRPPKRLDFSLGWDSRGFIRQTTSQDILDGICYSYNKSAYSFITQPPGTSSWANRLGDEYIHFIKTAYGSLSGKSVLEIGAGSLYIAERLVKEENIKNYMIFDPTIKEITDNPKIEIYSYFTPQMAVRFLAECGFNVLVCESEFDTLKIMVESTPPNISSNYEVIPLHDVFLGAAKQFTENLENISYYLLKGLKRVR